MPENTERFEMRVPSSFLAAIDKWRRKQPDLPSRSEAIRRLVEVALAGVPREEHRQKGRRKASDMAGEVIDRLIDQSAPVEERERRKRRLIKGPVEFREMRGRVSKPKR